MTETHIDRGLVLGVGIDEVSVHSVRTLVAAPRDTALWAVFTPAERNDASAASRPELAFSVALGGKEAVGKALGCGLAGIEWTDISTTTTGGRLDLDVTGSAARRAGQMGIRRWIGSWSHCRDSVTVIALGVGG